MNEYKDLLEHLGNAPEDQIAKSESEKFAALAKLDTNPSSLDIIAIRNECGYYALASGFAMTAINVFIELLEKDESSSL